MDEMVLTERLHSDPEKLDLLHMVNRLICQARDGEYGKSGFNKEYAKFRTMLARMKGTA